MNTDVEIKPTDTADHACEQDRIDWALGEGDELVHAGMKSWRSLTSCQKRLLTLMGPHYYGAWAYEILAGIDQDEQRKTSEQSPTLAQESLILLHEFLRIRYHGDMSKVYASIGAMYDLSQESIAQVYHGVDDI